jgi:hypothetical protein
MVGIGGKMVGKWWDSVGFDKENPLSIDVFSGKSSVREFSNKPCLIRRFTSIIFFFEQGNQT